jgi:H+-transporting ATPase
MQVAEPVLLDGYGEQDLFLVAALASKLENNDPIELPIFHHIDEQLPDLDWQSYKQLGFTPFDPVRKRTEAEIKGPDGESFKVAKGAPQVILELCHPKADVKDQADSKVNEFASQGYRTLGVARQDGDGGWQLLGILPLYDPPREDSKDTIQRAEQHGIQVKMVTGDNLAIAKEISAQLGLGTRIHLASDLFQEGGGEQATSDKVAQQVEQADGFAEVFPEHKYDIVSVLQDQGHIVGMTGDGVNDAPALKQANTGIAVSGATDAARSASELVLTSPGLSVIVKAVEEARRIFERMNSYAIYRITETIRIMIFVVLAMIVFNSYPITTVMIILLALLNDLPIMTIAFDNTWLDPTPVRWDMRRVLTVATTLGLAGVIMTFGMLVIGKTVLNLDQGQIQSLIYIKLAVAGHLTLFITRTRHSFFSKPYPAPILLVAILLTQGAAAAIVGFGILVTPIPWIYVGMVWAYCLAWVFINDWVKVQVYHHLNISGRHHRTFLDRLQRSFYDHRGSRVA